MVYLTTRLAQLTNNIIKSKETISLARKLATTAAQPNRNPNVEYTQLFINNRFVDAKSGKTFETINPANGKVITKVAEADAVNLIFFWRVLNIRVY